MAKLNLYWDDEQEREYIAITDSIEFEKECDEDGLKLKESINIDEDVTSWPTNRLLEKV